MGFLSGLATEQISKPDSQRSSEVVDDDLEACVDDALDVEEF
jgi:hypothetical protein